MRSFVQGALEAAQVFRRGSAMLLHGYRGSGKTSALRKIQSLVKNALPEAAVVEVPLRLPSTEAMLIYAIAEKIRRQVMARSRLTDKVERAIESLSSVSAFGMGVERKPYASPPVHPLTIWGDALDAVGDVPLLCICVDDCELLQPKEVGILKTIVETVSSVPVLLAVAGGPELMEKFSRRDASPILRAFSGAIFDLGQFTPGETREAVTAPVERARATGHWTPAAVDAIHHLTRGYPYLVQCFAAAAYRDGRKIVEEDVKGATPAALHLASSWLERELPEASDEDIRAFAKIASIGRSDLRSTDIIRMGINHLYISRLTTEGVLKRLARGHYELRKAPAIAYFHALRRGLVLD